MWSLLRLPTCNGIARVKAKEASTFSPFFFSFIFFFVVVDVYPLISSPRLGMFPMENVGLLSSRKAKGGRVVLPT